MMIDGGSRKMLQQLDDHIITRYTEQPTRLPRGPRHIAVAKRDAEGWEIRSVERARIEAVREAPGLSANTLTILGAPGEPALALLRYTHRQRRAFETSRFAREENPAGRARELPPVDADQVYAESIARPIRDAQRSEEH